MRRLRMSYFPICFFTLHMNNVFRKFVRCLWYMLFVRITLTVFRRVRKISKSDNYLLSVRLSVCLSVHMVQLGSHWTDCLKRDIWVLFENLSRKLKFYWNLTRIKGVLHEDWYTFSIITHSFLLRMINVSHKSSRENHNTHFVFNAFFSKILPFMKWKGKAARYRTGGTQRVLGS